MVKLAIKEILRKCGFSLTKITPQFSDIRSHDFLIAERGSARGNADHESKQTKVHLFWAYGELSKLEILCLLSYFRNGYDVNLWTYNLLIRVPTGITVRDAKIVFPESRVFTYKSGSYAAFADLFRYAILMKEGGLWSDTDVICLTPSSEIENSGLDEFLVTERTRDNKLVSLNNNLIYLRTPKPGCIVDLALGIADKFQVDRLAWGDCGPRLITTLALTYPKILPVLMGAEFANPIDWEDCPASLLAPAKEIPKNWAFLHCYNETWKRAGVSKDSPYPSNSLMQLVERSILSTDNKIDYVLMGT